ncbi:PEP-CTERM sorting domain-containing protein [Pelomonas sp. Root1444]|uniref:PEP-CTERM sorting domain-containing protein n=1 Tax=Pelomonas sp. Root1444 TaxID=1736464 RepID=UPI0009E6A4A6
MDHPYRALHQHGNSIAQLLQLGSRRRGALQCDSWQWSYYDNIDSWDSGSQFNPLSLTIEVAAPVPEPATMAMLILGLAVLAFFAPRQRG